MNEPKVWMEERGGIKHYWVRLPNRAAVEVGYVFEKNITEEILIMRAKAYWTYMDRVEGLANILRRKYPNLQVFEGSLPQPDVKSNVKAGYYVYVVRRKRVVEALEV